MASTVTLTVKINDNGDLQLLSSNAEKAAKSTDKLSKSSDKAAKATAGQTKQNKGVAGATSNSTKAFSKMTTGITGGLVPAYAVLAANIFAITAAFGALRRAAGFELLEQGLIRVGSAAGANLPYVAQGLRDITGAAISTEAAMSATALAFSSGFSTTQLEGLTKVARGASLALGRDMEDAMTRLVKGTAKLEPEILDELGIMVRLDDAVEEYAKSLNKSGDDLTQFERRQAFLNATIDQGTQKFGDVAKAIDPNAYDQLAASFADLTKNALMLVNQALGPLISFLASSPVALSGVLLAFGSTLLKTILPAIEDMSDSHKRASREAAISAKKASKVISVEYTKASKAAASGLSLLPKSIAHLAPKIQEGTLSLKEQAQVLKVLKSSEKLRAAALSKGLESTRAQRTIELQQIRDQIILTERLMASEGKKNVLGEKGKRAQGGSKASKITSLGLKEMEKAESITGKFGVAVKYSTLQMRSLAKVNGSIWTKIRIGATAARGAVTLFGTALLSAIPIIGQILMVASLLWPLFSGLFGKGKMEQELQKITDSFKSFVTIAEQLKETLAGDITATESFVATLRVQVGVMNQIISAHQKYIDKLKDDRLDTIMEKTKELQEMQKGGWQFSWVGGFIWGAVQSKSAITDLGIEISGLKDNLNTLDNDSMKTIAKEAKAMLTTTPELAAVMADNIAAYDLLIKEVSGSGKITTQEFMARLKELAREQNTTLAAIDGARQTMGDFTKETIALGSKVNTPFDNLIDKSKTLAVEFAASGKEGGMGFDAFKAGATGLQAQLDHIRASNFLPVFGLTDTTVLEIMNDQLTKVRDKILTSKARVKELGNEQKKLNKIAKDHPKALETSLQLSEDIRLEKISLLNTEKKGLDIIVKTAEQSERIIQIEAEKKALAAEKVSIEDRGLEVAIAEVQEKNKILALGEKLNSQVREALQHELKMADIAERVREAESGKKTTANDSYKRFKAEKETKQTIIAMELAGTLTSIEMEYALLDAQLALQKQRAIDAKLDVSAYTRIAALMAAGKAGAEQGAINTAVAATASLGAEDKEGERAVEVAVLGAATQGSGSAADKANNMILQGGFEKLDSGLEKMKALRGMFSQNLADLSALGPEGEAVSAAVNAFGIMGESALNFGEIVSGVFERMNIQMPTTFAGMSAAWDKMTLPDKAQIAAAAFNMAAQSIAGLASALAAQSAAAISKVDDQIDAEKKLDGQSAASVAKIKALEVKKEQMKKKAFETDKKMKLAMAIMSTAAGIASALTLPAPLSFIMAGIVGAMGLAQVAIISGMKYGGGAKPSASMPSSVSIGKRSSSVDLAKGNNASGELAYARGASGQGGMTDFKPTPAFTGTKYRASGGETAAFMVGEQGPEMFIPNRAGRIAPADETAKMNNAPTNVNFSIQAIDSAGIEDLLNNQRGNIISMIREAANSHGEFFLESVTDFPQEKQR